MVRPPGIKSLKEQIEEGEACDWEEYTREERYAFMDMAVLIEYIEYLESFIDDKLKDLNQRSHDRDIALADLKRQNDERRVELEALGKAPRLFPVDNIEVL